MSKLMHTPYRIGNIVISNRIVKSAMFEYCANQGKITDQHRQIYEDAARGGCGLIITGMEAISSTAGNGPGMIHTEYDGYLEEMCIRDRDYVTAHRTYLFLLFQNPE